MQPSKRKQKHTLTHLTFKAKKLDLRKQTKQKKTNRSGEKTCLNVHI